MKNASPEHYQKLLLSPHNAEVAEIIKTDLPRTFPDNIFFNNTENQQHQLYNVLLAFAHQNKTVGYCQVKLAKYVMYKYINKGILNKNLVDNSLIKILLNKYLLLLLFYSERCLFRV